MNTHEALKELIPWAKPACEDKAKAKRLARLTELYLENNNSILKRIIDRMIKRDEGGIKLNAPDKNI